MKQRSWVEALARLSFWVFSALTSLLGLLCWIPFTWTNFISARHYPAWVNIFLQLHGFGIAGVGLLAGFAFRKVWTGRIFALTLVIAGLLAQYQRWIFTWDSGESSRILAFAVWIPYLVWEMGLAWERPASPIVAPREQRAESLEKAAILAGLIVGIAYALPTFSTSGWNRAYAFAILEIVLLQIFPFLLVAAGMRGVHAFSALTARAYRVEMILLLCSGGSLLFWVLQGHVFEALDYRGLSALAYAAVFAAVGTFAYAREAVRIQDLTGEHRDDAQGMVLAPYLIFTRWGRFSRSMAIALVGVVTFAAPWVFERVLHGQDWNGLLESLSVLLVWVFCFVVLVKITSLQERSERRHSWIWPLMVLAISGGVYGIDGYADWAAPTVSAAHKVQRRWVDHNPSLRWLRSLFRSSNADAEFYAYLQSQTNISRDTLIVPKNITLGTPGTPLSTRPNIFIFVIDSLRPDYLGAYNPKVRFTPNLDAFARESWVFKQAFTVYGATGLSEPSIWSGAQLIHKQYIKPFAPMNSLEKLIEAEGYRRFITQDAILTELLKPSTSTDPLDAETTGNYLFCGTLKELTAKLPPHAQQDRPLFVYTQPQDVHVSVIQRNPGALTSSDPRFEGFYLPYASRIAAFDQCFGEFVGMLKAKGLYDNSLLILTADHGDSLGEGGRWGHAYTIYPEILRVPLVLRLPETLRAGQVAEVDSAAYLIDITPTLYSLLGWNMNTENPLFGRPLVASSQKILDSGALPERTAVSSYGPVYGVIEPQKNRLYIADAINYTSMTMPLQLDLEAHPTSSTSDQSKDYNARIRQHLDRLNAFYR